MASDVANSPLPEGLFDDSWNKVGSSNNGLDAIVDFNATFDQQNSNTIDPNLTFSNPATPQRENQDAFNFNAASTGFDQTFSPAASYEAYPTTFNEVPSSPYYSSVEMHPQPAYNPSPFRNERSGHRRSVSEPPGMPDAPQVLFHRDQHYLGQSIRGRPVPLKSLPRNKQLREYTHSTRKATRNHPYPPAQPGFRPGMLQRAQTQPVRPMHPPTSVPMGISMPQYIPPNYQRPHPQPEVMAEQQYGPASSSRVCTPIPEAVMSSPPFIDPALGVADVPANSAKKPGVAIPVSLEELKAIIFDAVREAINGKEHASPLAANGGKDVSPKAAYMEEAQNADDLEDVAKVER